MRRIRMTHYSIRVSNTFISTANLKLNKKKLTLTLNGPVNIVRISKADNGLPFTSITPWIKQAQKRRNEGRKVRQISFRTLGAIARDRIKTRKGKTKLYFRLATLGVCTVHQYIRHFYWPLIQYEKKTTTKKRRRKGSTDPSASG